MLGETALLQQSDVPMLRRVALQREGLFGRYQKGIKLNSWLSDHFAGFVFFFLDFVQAQGFEDYPSKSYKCQNLLQPNLKHEPDYHGKQHLGKLSPTFS